jgi:hypothetical protein
LLVCGVPPVSEVSVDVLVGVLVVPCGTLLRRSRSPPSIFTSSRSVDWVGVVFVEVR